MMDSVPERCPIGYFGENYKPYQHEGMYEFFRQARKEEPVFYYPDLGFWVVTRQKDIDQVFRDNENYSAFSSNAPINPLSEEFKQFLADSGYTVEPMHVNLDGPEHARIRQIAARYLNLRTFSRMEDDIRELVREHIDRMKGHDTVDIVEALFYELPARVMLLLLGVREFDPLKIKAWTNKRLHILFGKLEDDELLEAGRQLVDFWFYAKSIVSERSRQPKDDYPSYLLEVRNGDDSILTMNQIESSVFGQMFAGHETTTNASGNLVFELLKNRDQWEKLVEDPSLIGQAVEEGLRYVSSVVAWRRTALNDVEVGGVKIPAGDLLLLATGSANRDEDFWENGETLDVTRTGSRSNYSFGKGIHQCLGAPLARVEMRVILEELVATFPKMRLVDNQKIDWIPTISFRGPVSLLVRPNG